MECVRSVARVHVVDSLMLARARRPILSLPLDPPDRLSSVISATTHPHYKDARYNNVSSPAIRFHTSIGIAIGNTFKSLKQIESNARTTSLSFTCKTRMPRFARQCRDTIQVRWEAFTSCHGKFNQENMYQILSESARFVKDIIQAFWCVFCSQSQLLFTCKMRMLSFTR